MENGTTLKSSLAHLLAIPDTSPKLEGLLFINTAENTAPPARMQRLQKHIALCSDLIQLSDCPVVHLLRMLTILDEPDVLLFYMRFVFSIYVVLLMLTKSHAEKLPAELTKQIGAIIESFQTGVNADIWKDQCRQLQETMMF